MSEGESLGEILGRALRAEPCPTPVPMEWDYECARYLVAGKFAQAFCECFSGLDFEDVWERLIHVPENKLKGLESPLGWSLLASYLAGQFGITGEVMQPTIN